MNRLPWERTAEGFIAYPDGSEHADRVARISRSTSLTGYWNWIASCGLAKDSGTSRSTQEASNAANKSWPKLVIKDAALQGEARKKADALAKIDQVTVEADPDVVSIFAIAAADQENLSWIMDQVRHRTRTPGIAKLIDALSRELFKFRTGERK